MNLGRENEIVEFKETSGEINEAVIDIVAMLNKHGRGHFGNFQESYLKGKFHPDNFQFALNKFY